MKGIKIIIGIIILLSVFYFFAVESYNCGEYEGQRTQYSFFKFKNSYRVNSSGEILEPNIADYTQLHQYTGGWFYPLCYEDMGFRSSGTLLDLFLLPIYFLIISLSYLAPYIGIGIAVYLLLTA